MACKNSEQTCEKMLSCKEMSRFLCENVPICIIFCNILQLAGDVVFLVSVFCADGWLAQLNCCLSEFPSYHCFSQSKIQFNCDYIFNRLDCPHIVNTVFHAVFSGCSWMDEWIWWGFFRCSFLKDKKTFGKLWDLVCVVCNVY